MTDQLQLKSISLKGFKSFDTQGQTIDFAPLAVMLGANGAGKSNLVSFFIMLQAMTRGRLQQYVAEQGFADSLIYFGAKVTSTMSARLSFENSQEETEYHFHLERDATDRLFLREESIVSRASSGKTDSVKTELGRGVRESQLKECSDRDDETCRSVFSFLSGCRVFQFHDTSATAKIRGAAYIDDSRFLRSDAGNLGPFLRGLKIGKPGKRYYERIVRHIRLAVPQFGDFDLGNTPGNDRYVRLNWREKKSDHLFGPHQLSDGSLRFMALTTLFLQPPDLRPRIIVVDEPELGLHPAAISALAGMVKAAALESQVILATQSSRLIDEFSADQVVVVEYDEIRAGSVFRRLDFQALSDWLERYCLSDLWEKNVLGGRP